MELVAIVFLSLKPAWFSLGRSERDRLRRELFDELERHNSIKFSWFDADAWTGNGSEFLICEFEELSSYWDFWASLREHSFFRSGFAEFQRVSLGYERPLSLGLVET